LKPCCIFRQLDSTCRVNHLVRYPFATMNITPVKPLAESDKISFALERKVQTNNTLKMTHHDGVKLPWVHMNGEETKTYSDVSSSFQDRCSEMVCVRRYEAHNDFQKLDFQNEKASTNLGKLISKLLQKDDSPFSEANVIPKILSNIENARLESLIQIHKVRQAPPASTCLTLKQLTSTSDLEYGVSHRGSQSSCAHQTHGSRPRKFGNRELFLQHGG
jgi:hypothetical protein